MKNLIPSNHIILHSGKLVSPFDLKPDDITIEDIAYALSNICRFGGHCNKFYSVAQHSILVAYQVGTIERSRTTMLGALLHDAPEAYLGDRVAGIKTEEDYAIEARVFRIIAEKFDFDFGIYQLYSSLIHEKDMVLRATELRDLFPGVDWSIYDLELPAPLEIRISQNAIYPWRPKIAYNSFMESFHLYNLL